MPLKCCVVNCSMRGDRDKGIKFFRFPMIPTKRPKYKQLAEERQLAWLNAINRNDLKRESLKYSTVCSKHFISGSSANLQDKSNVDWVPSVDMDNPTKTASRYDRTKKITAPINDIAHKQMVKVSDLNNQNPSHNVKACQTEALHLESAKDNLIAQLRNQNKFYIETIKQLKQENLANRTKLTIDDLKANPKMTKYYTGFNDFETMEVVFKNVQYLLPITVSDKMNQFDVFLMALIKLRLDLPFTHLAYQYQVSNTTISMLFHKAIVIIHDTISCFVFWPDNEASRRNIPKPFKQLFGMRPVFIIDCFEIFSETPGNCLARAKTFANYKHHQMLKYLICISSFGSISFISQGYGGRCSDKFIFESCGILDCINEGDIILADRSFLIDQSVNNKKARLIMPSFKNAKSQMEPLSVENNHRIASVRIHVERIIGVLRQNFLVTTIRKPISTSSNKFNENMYFDYIIKISCAVFNLNPSIVVRE